MTILMDRMPKSVKIPINHLAQVFSILYCAVLIVGTYQYAVRLYHHGTTLGSIYSAPQWIGAAVIPIGLLLMGLFLVIDLPRVQRQNGNVQRRKADRFLSGPGLHPLLTLPVKGGKLSRMPFIPSARVWDRWQILVKDLSCILPYRLSSW